MTMMKKRAKEMDHLNRPRILGTSMKKFAVREWVSRRGGFGGEGGFIGMVTYIVLLLWMLRPIVFGK